MIRHNHIRIRIPSKVEVSHTKSEYKNKHTFKSLGKEQKNKHTYRRLRL